MNAKKLIATAAMIAAAGSAFAVGSVEFEDNTHFVSTKTRAEVIAELEQARAEGQLATTEWAEPATAIAKNARTRDEVRAEAIRAAKTKKTDSVYVGD